MCCVPGAVPPPGGSKVSGNSQHEVKPARNCEFKSAPDPDVTYGSKSKADHRSDYVSKSEPGYDPNYKSELEANYVSDFESEAESEANYECGAGQDGQMHDPLESCSAPASISLALNIKAKAQLVPVGSAMLPSYHSSLPVNIKDQSIAEVQPAQQDAAGKSSVESQSQQPHLSALVPSLKQVRRDSTWFPAASPTLSKAPSSGQAAAAAALASPHDSKPECSSQCKSTQRLKKLVLNVRPSCMRIGTHSHQQEEDDVQPLPAAAAASHANQTQYAQQPQKVTQPDQSQNPQRAAVKIQVDKQPLPADTGSSAKQPEITGLSSRMPSLTKLALLRHNSTEVLPDATPVQKSTVSERQRQQQQQQKPMPAMASDRKRVVSRLTGLIKPTKAASKQGPLGAAGGLATQSLQEAAAAELVPALRQPVGVAQQAGQSPQLQIITTAAAEPAIQVNSLIVHTVNLVWQPPLQLL